MFGFYIETKQDLADAIEEFGFVPYFANSIPGFSIEENVSPDVWFSGEDGVWEWKGPIISETGCAYGKFFENKAAFISRKWFADFANFRRDGYDFEGMYNDGLVPYRDKDLYDLICSSAPVLSKRLKLLGNYRRGGNKGFDTIISRLQRQTFVVISDFVYETDRHGNTYGWGVAEYSTPELSMGRAFSDRLYRRSPEESYKRILKHFKKILPDADEKNLTRFLKGGR